MMKTVFKTISALLFNIMMGVIMATLLGVPLLAGPIFMVGVGTVMSISPAPVGALRAGVYTEIGQVSL